MYTNLSVDWKGLLTLALILATAGLALSLLLFGWIVWRVRRIQIPPGADALTTLRITPLIVVVLLDLLDFSLDFLAAPFAWVILNYLGLKSLRGLTVVESLIPGTQFLPTMTVAWIVARLSRPKLG
ncbi:MAG TPA: hypothetical protein VJ436_10985 [Anaerolineales bacterium]|nr:hypothetical protein [Anaerolineales bacterium]